ncbi:peptidylprolyl isomerase [Dubosiella newyorkensis]|uniref:peptidylprolyl isomerase n=1 Tax=Dubosiella newyorkensis TaxID=1862672 RepID=UPI00259CBBC7|nr:peptidylprolyl isomerase [Dubosiella newyorkensis]
MSDLFKDNWFVILIAVIIIAFVGYFVYDSNTGKVASKKADGKDVVASLADSNITADALFENFSQFDGALLYNLYRNAVVEQSVETTKEMEEQAKSMEKTIRSNVSSQNSSTYWDAITQELASYGYGSYDDLYDYALMTVKQRSLNQEYVDAHFENLKDSLKDAKPRIVSIIKMEAADPQNLTDEETKKRDSIDKAIESDSFAQAATAFSDDAATAAKDGLFGYVDSSSSASSTGLDQNLLTKALEMEKGETSDWIEVKNTQTGVISLYKIYVDETDLEKIHQNKDEDVKKSLLFSILNAKAGLEADILENAAKDLKIEFEDQDAKEKLDRYIEQLKGGNA